MKKIGEYFDFYQDKRIKKRNKLAVNNWKKLEIVLSFWFKILIFVWKFEFWPNEEKKSNKPENSLKCVNRFVLGRNVEIAKRKFKPQRKKNINRTPNLITARWSKFETKTILWFLFRSNLEISLFFPVWPKTRESNQFCQKWNQQTLWCYCSCALHVWLESMPKPTQPATRTPPPIV